MSKSLRTLSIAAILTAAACSDPTVPRLPQTEEEPQDTTSPKTGILTPSGVREPGPSAFLVAYRHA